MSEVAERIDTDKVRLPGGLLTPTVAVAEDRQLEAELPKFLEAIRSNLAEYGLEPDDEGLPPEGFESAFPRGGVNNLSVLERHALFVRAVRQELAEREANRQKRAQAERENARKSLEQMLANGPANLAEFRQIQADAVPAAERLRQFVADVHAIGRANKAAKNADTVVRGIHEAAEALGKPEPKLPPEPEGAATQDDVDAVLYLIRGGACRGFDDKDVPRPGDYGNARELGRKL